MKYPLKKKERNKETNICNIQTQRIDIHGTTEKLTVFHLN